MSKLLRRYYCGEARADAGCLAANAEEIVDASSNVVPPRRKRAATHLAEPHFDKDALLAELRKLQSENEALKAGRKIEYDEPDQKKVKKEA